MSRVKGSLVVNGFLKTEKFQEHYRWLQRAAAERDVELDCRENSSCPAQIGESFSWLKEYGFILYWDKDIRLGKLLEQECRKRGILVCNSIEGIAACDDKFETYYRLQRRNRELEEQEKIPLIPTVAAPMTYENVGYPSLEFLEEIVDRLGLPIVVKECFGSFGMQVYLANTWKEAVELTRRLAGRPFLYQQYQKESSGKDIRLQVVGDRVVAGMYRYSVNGDFRANITNGGQMEAYQPSREEQELAVRVADALGLDFAGVDLLTNGLVCEVNSNAHFKNIYTCTGVNVAECILDHILDRLSGKTGKES